MHVWSACFEHLEQRPPPMPGSEDLAQRPAPDLKRRARNVDRVCKPELRDGSQQFPARLAESEQQAAAGTQGQSPSEFIGSLHNIKHEHTVLTSGFKAALYHFPIDLVAKSAINQNEVEDGAQRGPNAFVIRVPDLRMEDDVRSKVLRRGHAHVHAAQVTG